MQLRGSGITLEKIMSQSDSQRKTNIICTMGPSCWDTEMLVSLIDQGMNVARLNFSHGDHKSHGETVQRLHEAKAQRPDKHVALMLDTKGPEIRTGFLQPDFKPLHVVRGQSLELITDYSVLGDNTKLAVSYKALPESCHVGMTILAADGSLVMTVTEILETSVMVTLDCNATIGERKNMNLPGVKVDLPVLTEKDINDLVDFGLEYPIDMIALSFTQSAEDIEMCRKVWVNVGLTLKLFLKLKTKKD
jgi:pyruvate kinase